MTNLEMAIIETAALSTKLANLASFEDDSANAKAMASVAGQVDRLSRQLDLLRSIAELTDGEDAAESKQRVLASII